MNPGDAQSWLLFLLFGGTVVVTSAFATMTARIPGNTTKILALWLFGFAQVVILSQILSELGMFNRSGFAIGHLLFLLLAFIFWMRYGKPSVATTFGSLLRSIIETLRRYPYLLGVLASLVLLLTIANLIYAYLYPSQNVDANAYHLPRAYFWWQLGTARHFPTTDFRHTEFPPNASFLFAWIMATSTHYGLLHLPQWIAGITAAVGVVSLARLAGFCRPAALFSGLIYLTYPMTVLQMASSQIDHITAATTVSFVVFSLRLLYSSSSHWKIDAILASIAFGLAVGTKLTVFFIFPGFIVVIIFLAARTTTHEMLPRLKFTVVTLLAGTVTLGSYNYILNVLDFAHPIASEQARSFALSYRDPEAGRPVANLSRYLYQSLDWPGLAHSSLDALPRLQHSVTINISDYLGLDIDKVRGFEAIAFDGYFSEDLAGFGPIGFLVLILAPPLLLFQWFWWKRDRRVSHLVAAGLTVIGWGWLLAFALFIPWTPYKTRYFLIFVPILSAVVLPTFWQLCRSRIFIVAPLAIVAVSGAVHVIVTGPGGLRSQPARRGFGPRIDTAVELLRTHFSSRSTIGIATDSNSLLFPLIRNLPGTTFVPIMEDDLASSLERGNLQAGVSGFLSRVDGYHDFTSLPSFFVHVASPGSFWRRAGEPYGLVTEQRGVVRTLTFYDVNTRAGSFGRPLKLPSDLVRRFGSGLLLVLPLEPNGRGGSPITAICNDFTMRVRRFEAGLGIEVPTQVLHDKDLFARISLDPAEELISLPSPSPVWAVPLDAVEGSTDGEIWRNLAVAMLPWAGDTLTVGNAPVRGAKESGFHGQENAGGPMRWTSGKASLIIPLRPGTLLTSLRIALKPFSGAPALKILLNDITVFEGTLSGDPWTWDFPLVGVGPAQEARIEIMSTTFSTEHDRRELGVPIRGITLTRSPVAVARDSPRASEK